MVTVLKLNRDQALIYTEKVKVVHGGYHRNVFGVEVKAVNLIGGRRYLAVRSGLNARIYACPNHTDDGIHLDHGYLDTLDNPIGPP